jgi:hypothetical protein
MDCQVVEVAIAKVSYELRMNDGSFWLYALCAPATLMNAASHINHDSNHEICADTNAENEGRLRTVMHAISFEVRLIISSFEIFSNINENVQ